MTPIQIAMAAVAAQDQQAPKRPTAAPRKKQRVTPRPAPIAETDERRRPPSPVPASPDPEHPHYGRCIKTIPAPPEAQETPSPQRKEPGFPRHLLAEDRPTVADENRRMALVEGQREAQLIAEAEAEAHQRHIARCEAEIRQNRNKPADVNERAGFVHIGTVDWEAEKAVLEGHSWPLRNIGRRSPEAR
jgi:hypothetical protein